MATSEKLAAELRQRARGGWLACAAALALARELGVSPHEVGRAADELGIKIADCQLGCFGAHRGAAGVSGSEFRVSSSGTRNAERETRNVVCIVGQKHVGKTTLIERLVPELRRRGYRVATVKRPAHHFEFDLPGKDSRRFFEAGAEASLVYGDEAIALARRPARPPRLEELLAEYLAEADLVLVEGHKSSSLPKIEVFRAGTHPRPLYCGQPDYLAIASNAPLDLGLPWLDLNDAPAIAAFIAARFPLESQPR